MALAARLLPACGAPARLGSASWQANPAAPPSLTSAAWTGLAASSSWSFAKVRALGPAARSLGPLVAPPCSRSRRLQARARCQRPASLLCRLSVCRPRPAQRVAAAGGGGRRAHVWLVPPRPPRRPGHCQGSQLPAQHGAPPDGGGGGCCATRGAGLLWCGGVAGAGLATSVAARCRASRSPTFRLLSCANQTGDGAHGCQGARALSSMSGGRCRSRARPQGVGWRRQAPPSPSQAAL